MGAILFIVISVLVYGLKIVHNSRHLTYDKWCEIFISFFIFTNCLGFGLPLIELDRYYVDGVFGFKYRLEVYMLITPIFFIVLSKRMKWHSMRIPWYVVLALTVFAAVNIFNPSNVISSSTILAIAQIFSYLLFLYIVCSCVNIDTLLKGIYEGLVYTTLLQLILTICYPILGITAVVELFREGVSIRAAERPGAPGLGTYCIFCSHIYLLSHCSIGHDRNNNTIGTDIPHTRKLYFYHQKYLHTHTANAPFGIGSHLPHTYQE